MRQATFKSTLVMAYDPNEGETAQGALEEYAYSYDLATSFELVSDECEHAQQYVNDRSQLVCRDCGDELGR